MEALYAQHSFECFTFIYLILTIAYGDTILLVMLLLSTILYLWKLKQREVKNLPQLLQSASDRARMGNQNVGSSSLLL